MNIATAWADKNTDDLVLFLKHGITIFEDIYDDFSTKRKLDAISPKCNLPKDRYAELIEEHSSFLQIESCQINIPEHL